MLVDTHSHLQDKAFDTDREEVLTRALAELEWLVVVGDTVASSRAAASLVRPGVYATAGIHPHHAAGVGPADLEAVSSLLDAPGVVALGEIGLDYHYEFSPRSEQITIFEQQLELAARLQKPVVIHCREAQKDMIAILQNGAAHMTGGIMHCFPGGVDFAEQCLQFGFHISFAGNLTFRKAEALRVAAQAVPEDRLLVETDSPYLAPVPVRGRRCEPAFVVHTARCLAALKNLPLEEFARITTANARCVFRLS